MSDIGSLFKKMSRYTAINIVIVMVGLGVIVFSVWSMLAYLNPSKLEETTGAVAKFEQRERDLFDSVANTSAPYFRVWFEDGLYYEATGICYNNINNRLFDDLTEGNEITLTYAARVGASKRIYGITYNGETYLFTSDVLRDLGNERAKTYPYSIVAIVATVVVGVALFIWNFKRNRQKKDRNAEN